MTTFTKTKPRPISDYALAELRYIRDKGPIPRSEINPGAGGRLWREGFVRVIDHPSPFPRTRGRDIEHWEITDAGRAVLEEE